MIREVVLIALYMTSGQALGTIFTHMVEEDDSLLEEWFVQYQSVILQECALRCFTDTECSFLSHNNGNCHLFTTYNVTSTMKVTVLGMKTFMRNWCPSQYSRVGDSCLRFVDTLEKNDVARSQCQEEGARLLSIATDSKFQTIIDFIANNGMYF
ncbi:uncharacterized protein [Haliotis cracherodii]|uniref:uncharacterized protein n=1 Tax=Haliotis cracherodii TaxID=6455 RepID=UPI0039E992B2